jgi:hypothetical protein
MNFKELFEGVEPKMPGAPEGIQIMTPQQFVAKAGDEKEVDETINMSDIMSAAEREKQRQAGKRVPLRNFLELAQMLKLNSVQLQGLTRKYPGFPKPIEGIRATNGSQTYYNPSDFKRWVISNGILDIVKAARQSMAEATKLPASSREFGGDEFQDYMKRIVGTPDLDKEGNVKVDKKGNEKYVSGKTKTDRYKMPYIHRSSVVEYVGPDGQTYSEDKIKQALAQRPKALLKQNEKMKHSNGDLEQFFNVGFAALTGIALDEDTNKLIIVNTCPGAGSCKVDCFAMKGGKVQFKAAWLSDGRILTYLLNDPDGFFSQLSNEIAKEEKLGQKGGYTVTIRWHDAGDFFSPEYLDLALKMAAKHPDTKFYAYTKMAGAALGQKPPNFIINWSEGANTGQEKQVKAKDANLDTTKNSRIVPDDLFQDLLVKDEKKNLVKGSSGQWQVQPDKLPELKNRLAKEYGLSSNSILSYDEYMSKRKSIPAGMKYNVIVAPGEGDISANDPNIISTLLLKH